MLICFWVKLFLIRETSFDLSVVEIFEPYQLHDLLNHNIHLILKYPFYFQNI